MPEFRQDVISRFTKASLSDNRISAAFLGGSLASKTSDEFSDLDLYLVISDQQYESFFPDRFRFLDLLGRSVFAEDFDEFGFDMIVFILENGIEGELSLGSESRFLHIHGGPIEILVDKKEILKGVVFPLNQPEESDQISLLRRNIHWFWRELSLFSVAAKRGQAWTAYGYLDNARRRILNLLRVKYDFDHWPAGYEKVEEILPSGELASLRSSLIPIASMKDQSAALQLIKLYRPIATELCRKYAIDYPSELEKIICENKLNILSESFT